MAARRAVSRAITSPLAGSSMTRTPGTSRATAPVSSVLALLTTEDFIGGTGLRSKRAQTGGKGGAPRWQAQTMTVTVICPTRYARGL